MYPGEDVIDTFEGLEEKDLKSFRPTHLMETLDGQGNQENADDFWLRINMSPNLLSHLNSFAQIIIYLH